jgi:2,3-bisphosphoglycerate-independent phosphoglycerate mutase
MLVVLDGFGLGDGGPGDATARAHAPWFERARRLYPTAKIETSGESVGLPPGQMGNSEVGHMTMGAGRIMYQDMTRISKTFDEHGPESIGAIRRALHAAAAGNRRQHQRGRV